MTFFRPVRSLFWRLFAGFAAVILVTTASFMIIVAVFHELEAQTETLNLHLTGRKAEGIARAVLRYGGTEELVDWLKSPMNTNPAIYVLAEDGTELSGRAVPEQALRLLRDRHAALSGDPVREISHMEIDGRTYLLFAVRTQPAPFRILPLLENRSTPVTLFFFISLLLSFLAAWALAAHFTRPLSRLVDAMKRFSDGRLDTRIEGSIGNADAEVAGLARMFDRMAGRIEDLVERRRRLLHSVSHEVRSPLARIDVALELARRNPARLDDYLERIGHEVHAIDRLVEGLLVYARLDRDEAAPLHPVPILPLLESEAASAGFEAQKKSVAVRTHFSGANSREGKVLADEAMLAGAFDNIFRNAIRFAPVGSLIDLEALFDESEVRIFFRDRGPGIPEAQIERMFEPFARGASEAPNSGFGLGLSIAKRAVLAHRGSIRARNLPEPGGFEVEIALPLL